MADTNELLDLPNCKSKTDFCDNFMTDEDSDILKNSFQEFLVKSVDNSINTQLTPTLCQCSVNHGNDCCHINSNIQSSSTSDFLEKEFIDSEKCNFEMDVNIGDDYNTVHIISPETTYIDKQELDSCRVANNNLSEMTCSSYDKQTEDNCDVAGNSVCMSSETKYNNVEQKPNANAKSISPELVRTNMEQTDTSNPLAITSAGLNNMDAKSNYCDDIVLCKSSEKNIPVANQEENHNESLTGILSQACNSGIISPLLQQNDHVNICDQDSEEKSPCKVGTCVNKDTGKCCTNTNVDRCENSCVKDMSFTGETDVALLSNQSTASNQQQQHENDNGNKILPEVLLHDNSTHTHASEVNISEFHCSEENISTKVDSLKSQTCDQDFRLQTTHSEDNNCEFQCGKENTGSDSKILKAAICDKDFEVQDIISEGHVGEFQYGKENVGSEVEKSIADMCDKITASNKNSNVNEPVTVLSPKHELIAGELIEAVNKDESHLSTDVGCLEDDGKIKVLPVNKHQPVKIINDDDNGVTTFTSVDNQNKSQLHEENNAAIVHRDTGTVVCFDCTRKDQVKNVEIEEVIGDREKNHCLSPIDDENIGVVNSCSKVKQSASLYDSDIVTKTSDDNEPMVCESHDDIKNHHTVVKSPAIDSLSSQLQDAGQDKEYKFAQKPCIDCKSTSAVYSNSLITNQSCKLEEISVDFKTNLLSNNVNNIDKNDPVTVKKDVPLTTSNHKVEATVLENKMGDPGEKEIDRDNNNKNNAANDNYIANKTFVPENSDICENVTVCDESGAKVKDSYPGKGYKSAMVKLVKTGMVNNNSMACVSKVNCDIAKIPCTENGISIDVNADSTDCTVQDDQPTFEKIDVFDKTKECSDCDEENMSSPTITLSGKKLKLYMSDDNIFGENDDYSFEVPESSKDNISQSSDGTITSYEEVLDMVLEDKSIDYQYCDTFKIDHTRRKKKKTLNCNSNEATIPMQIVDIDFEENASTNIKGQINFIINSNDADQTDCKVKVDSNCNIRVEYSQEKTGDVITKKNNCSSAERKNNSIEDINTVLSLDSSKTTSKIGIKENNVTDNSHSCLVLESCINANSILDNQNHLGDDEDVCISTDHNQEREEYENISSESNDNILRKKSCRDVIMRDKYAKRCSYEMPTIIYTEDHELQQKIDFEIKMRDGTAKLLAASRHPHQLLEAAKNLLTSNTRMIAYMSELQKRKTDEVMKRNSSEELQPIPCAGTLSISDLRVPLMWKDTDYFKNKGDHRRFAVFCLLKIGTEIYDTSLVKDVDRSMPDITFDDVIVFNKVRPDFELQIEVYSHRLCDDLSMASTPRKIKKKINEISSSVGRSVGRRLSGLKEDPEFFGHMIVGPKFECIAYASLVLKDVNDNISTYDLTLENGNIDATQTELPLFGNFCVRLAGKPDCITEPVRAGSLSARLSKDNVSNECWATLKCGKLTCMSTDQTDDDDSDDTPAFTIPVNKNTQIVTKILGDRSCIEVTNRNLRIKTRHMLSFDNNRDQEGWFKALQQHILDHDGWQHVADSKMHVKPPTPQKAPVFLRKSSHTIFETSVSDSPMTLVLKRLNVDPKSPQRTTGILNSSDLNSSGEGSENVRPKAALTPPVMRRKGRSKLNQCTAYSLDETSSSNLSNKKRHSEGNASVSASSASCIVGSHSSIAVESVEENLFPKNVTSVKKNLSEPSVTSENNFQHSILLSNKHTVICDKDSTEEANITNV